MENIKNHSSKLYNNEKEEITDVALFFLENLADTVIDNNLYIDIQGGVIYPLNHYKIFSFLDINKLNNLSEGQIKCIFEVLNKALQNDDHRAIELKYLQNVQIFKANATLFNTINNYS